MIREFKYYPKDFGYLPVTVEHFNLTFNVEDAQTEVQSDMTMTAKKAIETLHLDAKNLIIKEVALYRQIKGKGDYEKDVEKDPLTWSYDHNNNKLHITLYKKQNETFTLYTKVIIRPTKHILEGLYYDETPKGAPTQQITQCQQWGFQRLTPCFDDMTAKCTYTTIIIADARYTNLISNGDAAPAYKNQYGEPIPKYIGNRKKKIIYLNHKTPMAPYLFFLGVGSYATFRKLFTYPNGRKIVLELLVPPDADKEAAQHALDMLAHGILWIYEQTDYMYTGDVYREIGMQNSNFGGMENVGNTTITTNRIMPFKQITDPSFEYMLQIKVHEFYHNLNGSEVTGLNPFCLWLNEAVTVHIETEYLSSVIGKDATRIDRIQRLYAPVFGTFAEDKGPAAMPVEPKGFNTPDELITGMTYVKAPEFVQMIETLIGKEKFKTALQRYYKRFRHSNATPTDWIAVMEEASNSCLKDMASGWLSRTGFPNVYVTTSYENGNYTINLKQKGFDEQGPWQFPFVFNLVKNGKDMNEDVVFLVKAEQEKIIIPVDEKPAYASLNRGHTLYGKVFWVNQTEEQRHSQAMNDPDTVNRYMAFSAILDNEKISIIENPARDVSDTFLHIYGKILHDTTLEVDVKASFLVITESVRNENYLYKYKEIYDAQNKLKKAIYHLYHRDLELLYNRLSQETFSGNYVEQYVAAIKNRSLKNTALSILSVADDEQAWNMLRRQLERATNATDKNTAMALLLNSNAPDRKEALLNFKKIAQKHLVSWENFLAIVGGNNKDDAIELMKDMEKDPFFRIEQSNDQRALYFSFAKNRKKSLLTDDGLQYLTQIIIKVSRLNEYTGFNFLSIFADVEKLMTKQKIISALEQIRDNLSLQEHPSVVNNINRILNKYDN